MSKRKEFSMETRILNIVGVTFENRQEILKEFYDNVYKEGSRNPIQLLLEDNNPYDKNAIVVALEINGELKPIGYISKDDNVELRRVFDKIENVYLQSMGANYKNILGGTIAVVIGDEEHPEIESGSAN